MDGRPVWVLSLLLAIVAGVAIAPVSSLEVSAVAGSGVLLVENPGGAYGTPTSAHLGIAVVPQRRRFSAGGFVTVAPFLVKDDRFQRSTLLIGELDLGYLFPFAGDLGIEIAAIASAGGYLRTSTVNGGESARRPTAGGAVRLSTTPQRGWWYAVEVRYRAIFDNAVVHSVQPSVGVGYAFRSAEDAP
jgi:hypothetical protein